MNDKRIPKHRTIMRGCPGDKSGTNLIQHLADILDYHFERNCPNRDVIWRNCLLDDLRNYIYQRETALKRFHWK